MFSLSSLGIPKVSVKEKVVANTYMAMIPITIGLIK